MNKKAEGYIKYMPFVFATALLFSIMSIYIALVGKQLIDNLLTLHTDVIIKVVCISFVSYIAGAFLGFVTSYLQKFIVDKIKIKLQLSFYDNMQKSEFVFFSNLSSSDIYYRMFMDIGVMVDYYLNLVINIPIKIITFSVTLAIMLYWSWKLTIAITLLIFIQLFITILFRKPIKKQAEISIEAEQSLIAKVNEDMLKSDLCRSLALENINKQNISKYFEIARKNRLKNTKINLLFSHTVGFVSQIINMFLLLLGVYFVSTQELSIGSLMGISILSGYIYQPLNDIFHTIVSFQSTEVSFRRFKEFSDSMDNKILDGNKSFVNGSFKIENLNFAYGNKSVIKNLNLNIKENKITFLEGKNGSGKTTLLRLLNRFILPNSGNIYLNQININEFNYDEYRSNVISVSSDPVLLNDSFYNNIAIGKDNITKEDVKKIIKQCKLDCVLKNLDDNLDVILGTGNIGLSKGEIQKISLARVLVRQPKILLLDEPISHIDIDSANEILDVLKELNLKYNTTIIIVGHDERIKGIADDIINIDAI